MRRLLRSLAVIAALGGALALAALAVTRHQGEPVLPQADQGALTVTVAPAIRREFRDEINSVGTLKARETVLLSPKVPGNVEAVLVDFGQRVEKDQEVVRLDRTTFELAVKQAEAAYTAAEAAVGQARAQFERAEKEYGRASKLLAERVISQSSFEAAEAAYRVARQALAAATDQHTQAKAGLQTAQEHLKNAVVRSPIAGTVVQRLVEVGQSVAPGAPLLRIVDQSSLKLDVDLPEADFPRAAIGQRVAVGVDVFPGREFEGKVTVVNPMVQRESRTFRVRVELSNPGQKLVDGMFARARLLLGKRTALGIPREALDRMPGSGTFYVFVAEGNKAKKRAVRIGVMEERFVEVVEGLAEGEKVIVSGTGGLRSDIEVAVVPAATDQTASHRGGLR
jgi:RND family efflux transporter MFP subunit